MDTLKSLRPDPSMPEARVIFVRQDTRDRFIEPFPNAAEIVMVVGAGHVPPFAKSGGSLTEHIAEGWIFLPGGQPISHIRMAVFAQGAEDIFAAQMAEVTGVFFRPDELRQFLSQRLPFLLLAQAEAQYQGVGGLTFRKALLIMQDKPLPEGTLDVRGQAAVFCRLLGKAPRRAAILERISANAL